MDFAVTLGAFYAGAMSTFYANKSLFNHVVLYEDLVASPSRELESLFQLLKIDIDNVPLALRALKKDSQNNRGYISNNDLFEFGPRRIQETEKLFPIFKVEKLSFDMSLDNFRATLQLS